MTPLMAWRMPWGGTVAQLRPGIRLKTGMGRAKKNRSFNRFWWGIYGKYHHQPSFPIGPKKGSPIDEALNGSNGCRMNSATSSHGRQMQTASDWVYLAASDYKSLQQWYQWHLLRPTWRKFGCEFLYVSLRCCQCMKLYMKFISNCRLLRSHWHAILSADF